MSDAELELSSDYDEDYADFDDDDMAGESRRGSHPQRKQGISSRTDLTDSRTTNNQT